MRELLDEEVRKGEGGGDGGRGRAEVSGARLAKLSALLRIGISCRVLLNVVAEEVLNLGERYVEYQINVH